MTLQQSQRLEALKIYISQWSDGCCIGCLVKKQSRDQEDLESEDDSDDESEWRNHPSNTMCPKYDFFIGGFHKYQKGRLSLFPDSGCFKCLLPTVICPKGAEGACKGGDIIHYFIQVCLQGSAESQYLYKTLTEVWEKYGLLSLRKEREKLREGLVKYDRDVFGTEAMVVVILFFEFSKVVFRGKGAIV